MFRFDQFTSYVDCAIGKDYSCLNSKGIIPEEALTTTKFNPKTASKEEDDA